MYSSLSPGSYDVIGRRERRKAAEGESGSDCKVGDFGGVSLVGNGEVCCKAEGGIFVCNEGKRSVRNRSTYYW